MKYAPHLYQRFGTEYIINNKTDCVSSGLLLEPGLGKTVVALTAIDTLMYDMFEISKVLVIAPKYVAEHTWTAERDKWDHLAALKMSVVLGTEKQRKEALLKKADIYVINVENVQWLIAHYGMSFPFDMVVLDESTKFKNQSSRRFKAFKSVRPLVRRVVILTGTPTPNGLLDLWPQVYLLDQGERLGNTVTKYREQYFVKGYSHSNEYNIREESDPIIGKDWYSRKIYDKIDDICISMKAKDWLELPERINNIINVHLPADIKKQYNEFEREMILELMDAETITAVNAAGLTNKLLQFANGAVYKEDKTYVTMHDEKLEALAEMVEASNGHPVLIFYSFKSDLERIKNRLKAYKPQEMKGSETITQWNAKKIPLLLAHPASAGHGLNLQAGGNIIGWFGLPWSLELYQQANARLDRQGQTESVIIHHFVTKGTMDQDVMNALENKANSQEALMQAVKARIAKYQH